MSTFGPRIRAPFGKLGWPWESKMVLIEMSIPHSCPFVFFRDCRPILHHLATIDNVADETDWNRLTHSDGFWGYF